jgi:NADH dehydrogenase
MAQARSRARVVIVGGGFGGLACARKLDGEPVDVLLIDAHNFHLFTPLLYQVATALLNPSDIAFPFRARFRRSKNVRFREDVVTAVDFAERTVTTGSGHRFTYDYLVLATGSENNYFGNQALADSTIGMKTLDQALRLRNHVLECLERAEQADDETARRRWLSFVIVGGGPTGVEYAGALGELLRLVLPREYPSLPRDLARIVLVEGLDRLLANFPQRLGRYAERTLRRRGVEVRTGTMIAGADELGARLSSGEEIECRTIVWAAGVRPSDPVGEGGPLPRSRSHRLDVDERLRVPGVPGVFAIGDAASVAEDGGELPMLSPPAMQEGRYVARLILDEVHGRPPDGAAAFRYRDKGTLATIGRNAAVGTVGRLQFRGLIGWVVWLVVHIYYLIGFRNRLAVLTLWGWNYLRRDRPIRIVTRAQPDPLTDSS